MARPATSALDEAVKSAVHDALVEHLPQILREHLVPRPPTRLSQSIEPALPPGDRFVSMAELCKRLGLNRTTVLRRERADKIPRRQTFPDGRSGWTASQIEEWFAAAQEHEPNHQENLARAARLERSSGGSNGGARREGAV